jgi:hypothetical protein
MGSREERVARNESTSREINERIEKAHEEASSDRDVRMVCECGHETCERLVAITLAEYKRLRSDPRDFAVVSGHVMEEAESVAYETDRFVVVRKREGTAADVAVEEDPRS